MGGVNSDQNYIDLRKNIHKILQIDVGYGEINQSSFYKDLLKNIKYHDVCFNFGSENPQKTGECNVDVIVGRYIKEDNPTIYMVANVTKCAVYDVTVGVISIDIKANKRQFMVNLSATQDNHSKSKYLFYHFIMRIMLRSNNIKIHTSIRSLSYYFDE